MLLISLYREQDLPNRNPKYHSNVKTSSNTYQQHPVNTNHPSKIQSNSKYATDQPSSDLNPPSSDLNPPSSFNTYKNHPNTNIPLSGISRNNDVPQYNTYGNLHTKNLSPSRGMGMDNKPPSFSSSSSSSSSSFSNNSYNNNTLNNSQYILQPSSQNNISNRSRVVTSTNRSSGPAIIHPNESSGLMDYSMSNISKPPKTLEEAKRLVSGLNSIHPKMGYTLNNSFPKPIPSVNLNNTSNTFTNTNPTNQPPRINYGHSNQNRKIPLNVHKNGNSPKIKYN